MIKEVDSPTAELGAKSTSDFIGQNGYACCVCGIGVVGMPVIKHIAQRGFEVYGYDIEERRVKGVQTFTNWDKVPLSTVYIVTVSTGHDNNPDVSAVYDVCKKISSKNQKALVSIESTVPVGTCRILKETSDLKYLVHCPHRYWSKYPRTYGVEQLRVIGGINKESLEKGLKFYKKLGIPLHVCSSIEVAEMCKIAENGYRFLDLAFAEELKMICDELDLDFNEVRAACNTKFGFMRVERNVNNLIKKTLIGIMEARNGIAGSCLPKDIRHLAVLSKSGLLASAIHCDELYKARLCSKRSKK